MEEKETEVQVVEKTLGEKLKEAVETKLEKLLETIKRKLFKLKKLQKNHKNND